MYDPCWHPVVARFAKRLAEPSSVEDVRRCVAAMHEWPELQFLEVRFWMRRDAFLADELYPETRGQIDPLFIDTNIVETQAILPHVPGWTAGWMKPFLRDVLGIAARTKPMRMALLWRRNAPMIDAG